MVDGIEGAGRCVGDGLQRLLLRGAAVSVANDGFPALCGDGASGDADLAAEAGGQVLGGGFAGAGGAADPVDRAGFDGGEEVGAAPDSPRIEIRGYKGHRLWR